ncbi:MAG: thioesterase family protein [Microthrixaceae bacterium]|nr:thioesterase family protein [Microthrixaceae bacterium]
MSEHATARVQASWTDSVAIEPIGEGRFRAQVGEQWSSLQGVHGGVVAALALTATERVLAELGVDPATTLRAATFGYVSGNVQGELEIEVEVIRRGRAMITSHATTSQGGKTTTVARFHHSTPWEGPVYSAAPPMPVRPEGTVLLARPDKHSHINNVETHLHPGTMMFAETERAEWLAWSRPQDGATFDAAWLAMFGDYFPPAVFTRARGPQRAVTIEYSLQIHDGRGRWTLGDDEYLAARIHAFHSHDGFAVEDGWIYLPDGSLLATVRQTRLAG